MRGVAGDSVPLGLPAGNQVTGTAGQRQGAASRPDTMPAMAPYLVIVLVLLAVFGFNLLAGVAGVLYGPSMPRLIVLVLLCLAGLVWQRRDLPFAFLAVAFAINADCVIYLAGSWQTYTLGLDNGLFDSVWLPVTAGLLAFLRPSLLLIPAMAETGAALALAGGTLASLAACVIISERLTPVPVPWRDMMVSLGIAAATGLMATLASGGLGQVPALVALIAGGAAGGATFLVLNALVHPEETRALTMRLRNRLRSA